MQTIIKINSLDAWYGNFQALKNVNLDIFQNEITALIGASGSGKSTLLKSLNRMLDIIPHSKVEGKVFFNNENILDEHIDVINLRRKVGMVFQNPTPFPKSIFDNVAYGLEIQGIKKKRRKKWWQMAAKAS